MIEIVIASSNSHDPMIRLTERVGGEWWGQAAVADRADDVPCVRDGEPPASVGEREEADGLTRYVDLRGGQSELSPASNPDIVRHGTAGPQSTSRSLASRRMTIHLIFLVRAATRFWPQRMDFQPALPRIGCMVESMATRLG